MPIEWDAGARQLHLHSERLSYIVRVREDGSLSHLHFGAPLAPGRDYGHLDRGRWLGRPDQIGDIIAQEVPTEGRGDQRAAAIRVEHEDGGVVLDPVYAGHRLLPGKPPLGGLPATFVGMPEDAQSVEIDLVDGPSGLQVTLLLTIFRQLPVIARSVRVTNRGERPVALTAIASAVLDLPDPDWRLAHLAGAWGRERHVVEAPLAPGRQAIGSRVGSSGHRHNPFLLLRRERTSEEAGEAIGVSLLYSGNFLASVELDAFGDARLWMGIDPETFRWTLEPGAAFQSPEALLCWTAAGLGDLSEALHGLFRQHLMPSAWRDRPRPVLLNTWEAAYFDFDEERLLAMAADARSLGVELFVLDDGWFGRRDDDTSSLGDWQADPRKLPSGLPALVRRVEELGLRFGLWMEPEMVSPRSELFARHPDWAIATPGRSRTELRHQYVLDLARPEVVDHVFEAMSAILGSAPISYLKWDMNRFITEPWTASLPGARQGEFFHRHALGVYDLHSRIRDAFPELLIEGCASGGGRFDPGLLAYAPQVWTSDQTDPVERLRISWGTSLAYPVVSMGAHVGPSPGHTVGRRTSLELRAGVAFFGAFGYELDLAALSADERARVAEQIEWYLPRRELLQLGRFLRLRSPFEGDGNEVAWMSVDAARRHAIVGWYRLLAHALPGPSWLRLRGLDPALRYRVSVWPAAEDMLVRANTRVRGGDELMSPGLLLDDDAWASQARGDFQVRLFELTAEGD